MDNQEPVHKRRARYQGTHPKKYSEKYKELQPEKYPETVAKILEKGNTPVGMHVPICVNEILDFLQIKPGQIGLDATLGYGGHSQAMLQRLQGKGHLYALDADPIEIVKTQARLAGLGYGSDLLTIIHMNFASVDGLNLGHGPLNFVLADLGVSSMQLDNPDRGFSYKKEGPLDLRLDPEKGMPASWRLRALNRDELEGMFTENADEPHAARIAKAIGAQLRRGVVIETTGALRKVIEDALQFLPADRREREIKKSCQRCFQALRIDVNSEYEVLYSFLEKLPNLLAPGARVAVLTFHSGEDRLVKKAFKQFFRQGVYSQIAAEVIRPSEEECRRNSRARSTKMRWAIKG